MCAIIKYNFWEIMHLIEITIYIITGISNLFINEKSVKFNSDEKKIISLSGYIRGAITFGLAMTIETGDINIFTFKN